MVRFWHLSAQDLAIVYERRREHNRLGFAVQLCLLRYPGWPLRRQEAPPQNVVDFVAEQMEADPAEIEAYPAWAETRREHLALLQKHFTSASTGHRTLVPCARICKPRRCLQIRRSPWCNRPWSGCGSAG